tara:strand:- start:438 stop:539 length:102 start_codon:yes stop_codon:yes gene_type:complete
MKATDILGGMPVFYQKNTPAGYYFGPLLYKGYA